MTELLLIGGPYDGQSYEVPDEEWPVYAVTLEADGNEWDYVIDLADFTEPYDAHVYVPNDASGSTDPDEDAGYASVGPTGERGDVGPQGPQGIRGLDAGEPVWESVRDTGAADLNLTIAAGTTVVVPVGPVDGELAALDDFMIGMYLTCADGAALRVEVQGKAQSNLASGPVSDLCVLHGTQESNRMTSDAGTGMADDQLRWYTDWRGISLGGTGLPWPEMYTELGPPDADTVPLRQGPIFNSLRQVLNTMVMGPERICLIIRNRGSAAATLHRWVSVSRRWAHPIHYLSRYAIGTPTGDSTDPGWFFLTGPRGDAYSGGTGPHASLRVTSGAQDFAHISLAGGPILRYDADLDPPSFTPDTTGRSAYFGTGFYAFQYNLALRPTSATGAVRVEALYGIEGRILSTAEAVPSTTRHVIIQVRGYCGKSGYQDGVVIEGLPDSLRFRITNGMNGEAVFDGSDDLWLGWPDSGTRLLSSMGGGLAVSRVARNPMRIGTTVV